MGLMSWLFGGGVTAVATGVRTVAEVFRPNAENDAARESAEFSGALAQFGHEFRETRGGWFDGLVDGLNRVPRPALALGCLGLFAYAMADPVGFAVRMQGLALVPEPLWWLLGAVVSFYFGARELHYLRENGRAGVEPAEVEAALGRMRDLAALRPVEAPAQAPAPAPVTSAAPPVENAALAAWRAKAA
jgi:hypothetical protein